MNYIVIKFKKFPYCWGIVGLYKSRWWLKHKLKYILILNIEYNFDQMYLLNGLNFTCFIDQNDKVSMRTL